MHRAVVVGCTGVVVAGSCIVTSAHLKLVAYAISVGIAEAVAVAVVSIFWEVAGLRSAWCCTCFFDIEKDAVVVSYVSVKKDLYVKRSRERTVGCDLCEEHLFIISCYSVGVSVEDKPTTTNGVIDEKILSVFEVVSPRVSYRFNDVDVSFSCCCAFRQTNGNIGIVCRCWEETE